MFDVCHPILYQIGLILALKEWLHEEITVQHHVVVSIKEYGTQIAIDRELLTFLFQAAKELAFNVVKHACASEMCVAVTWKEKNVTILVADNGIGFGREDRDARIISSTGYGLFNIRERVVCLGGTFEISSQLKCGSEVVLTVPVNSVHKASSEENK